MSLLQHDTTEGRAPAPEFTSGRLSARGHGAIIAGAIVAGVVVSLIGGGFAWGWGVIVASIVYLALIAIVSRSIEDARQAKDRIATAVMTMSFIIVLFPLLSVAWSVISNGAARFDSVFFTDTLALTPQQLLEQSQNPDAAIGGARHAIFGTLIITGLASLMSIPFGMFTAIYLVEYGGTRRLASAITAMVDVMTGIPSIVAGLFAYAMFVIPFGVGTRSGIAGAVALTVLMTPVVVRSVEEMLRLVPNELREASYALGVPKWKTIVKVVLPTAIAGILTGITLAIARVIGETAPLLVTAGFLLDTNLNPFSGRMTTLPVFTYDTYKYPTQPVDASTDRAWAAALTLAIIVAVLFSLARIMGNLLKPKGLK